MKANQVIYDTHDLENSMLIEKAKHAKRKHNGFSFPRVSFSVVSPTYYPNYVWIVLEILFLSLSHSASRDSVSYYSMLSSLEGVLYMIPGNYLLKYYVSYQTDCHHNAYLHPIAFYVPLFYSSTSIKHKNSDAQQSKYAKGKS